MEEKFSTDAPPEVRGLTPAEAYAYGWNAAVNKMEEPTAEPTSELMEWWVRNRDGTHWNGYRRSLDTACRAAERWASFRPEWTPFRVFERTLATGVERIVATYPPVSEPNREIAPEVSDDE